VPLEIVWSHLARARLQEIRAYVAMDKSEAADRLVTRIIAVVETLRNHPYLGHAGPHPEIRELVVGGSPYVVLYRVRGKRNFIGNIWHAAQPR